MKILPRSFYHNDTIDVARGLLGCCLVRRVERKVIRARIVETEGYVGEDDLACHASRGRTPRTEVMYGEAGHAYVYMVYGMYHCLNVVTEKQGFPAAVLIRAVEVEPPSVIPTEAEGSRKKDSKIPRQARNDRKENDKKIKTDGPGKLCRFLQIDRDLNGWDITKGEKLWIESCSASRRIRSGEVIVADRRVGIDYAKHCREYLWRFVLEEKRKQKPPSRAASAVSEIDL